MLLLLLLLFVPFPLHPFCWHSGVLVQPQWKHFKHFDMKKNDQVCLSNGIWRSWHIKCRSFVDVIISSSPSSSKLFSHPFPSFSLVLPYPLVLPSHSLLLLPLPFHDPHPPCPPWPLFAAFCLVISLFCQLIFALSLICHIHSSSCPCLALVLIRHAAAVHLL